MLKTLLWVPSLLFQTKQSPKALRFQSWHLFSIRLFSDFSTGSNLHSRLSGHSMRLPWTLQVKETKGKETLVVDLICSLPGVALPKTFFSCPKLGIY